MSFAQTTIQAQQARTLRDWLHTLLLLAFAALLLLAGSAFAGAREVKGFVQIGRAHV